MPSSPQPEPPRLVLITGLSGAGKSTASKALEDEGYFCIDNLPSSLLPAFLNEAADRKRDIGLVMDSRDQGFLDSYQDIIAQLRESGFKCGLLFFEAGEPTLLRRYSEMRRRHPFSARSVRDGILLERQKLSGVKDLADRIIDTSEMTPHMLRRQLVESFGAPDLNKELRINIVSFGFKNGPPAEADLIFDVRFLPNPYFVEGLKANSGLEPAVADYVLENNQARVFLEKLTPLLEFLVPQYRLESKVYLTIGIGCTGGRHRSVAMAEKLKLALKDSGEKVSVFHRDVHV